MKLENILIEENVEKPIFYRAYRTDNLYNRETDSINEDKMIEINRDHFICTLSSKQAIINLLNDNVIKESLMDEKDISKFDISVFSAKVKGKYTDYLYNLNKDRDYSNAIYMDVDISSVPDVKWDLTVYKIENIDVDENGNIVEINTKVVSSHENILKSDVEEEEDGVDA